MKLFLAISFALVLTGCMSLSVRGEHIKNSHKSAADSGGSWYLFPNTFYSRTDNGEIGAYNQWLYDHYEIALSCGNKKCTEGTVIWREKKKQP